MAGLIFFSIVIGGISLAIWLRSDDVGVEVVVILLMVVCLIVFIISVVIIVDRSDKNKDFIQDTYIETSILVELYKDKSITTVQDVDYINRKVSKVNRYIEDNNNAEGTFWNMHRYEEDIKDLKRLEYFSHDKVVGKEGE